MLDKQFFTNLENRKEKIERIMSKLHESKNLMKLKKALIKFIDDLESVIDRFWSVNLSLSEREKILEKTSVVLKTLFSATKILYERGTIGQDMIVKVTPIMAQLGEFDLAISLIRETLWLNETFSNLATIADIGYESGLIDESVKALNRLEEMGFRFFEMYYNKALVLYMMGHDLECLRILDELEKNYSIKKSLIGLKVAALIANNKIDEAKRLSLMRREDKK